MKKAIIVSGMHRSGTSMVGELIHRWGAYGGDTNELKTSDISNPNGYWENLSLQQFNEEILASLGSNWLVPPPYEIEIKKKASDPNLREKALVLINKMQNGGNVWFWKDPRLSVLLPFWNQILTDTIYIICVRNPLDIALSLNKKYGFPISASLLLWQRYMLCILREVENIQTILSDINNCALISNNRPY